MANSNSGKNASSGKSQESSAPKAGGAIKDQVHDLFDKARDKVKEVARNLEQKIEKK